MKSQEIVIRKYTSDDLSEVLALIGKSDSTNRTKETWVGNDMTAILAFEGEKLIGIIPFEKRKIVLHRNTEINALWVSAAHIEPAYRRQGIGTRLDDAIGKEFSPEFKAVFVIREDQLSDAYRWYVKLGYQHLAEIISLKLNVAPMEKHTVFTLIESVEKIKKYGPKLKKCFNDCVGDFGGYPKRDELFWAKKFETHYYKDHYKYCMIIIEVEEVQAYALIGRTNLRDDIDRLDILELIVPGDDEIRKDLFKAILNYGDQIKCKEVRIQLTDQDPLVHWCKGLGFAIRWQTHLLGKYIDSDNPLTGVKWKFFHIDYI